MNNLNIEINKLLLSKGASLVGFSDLSGLPNEQRLGYDYGISIAIALNPKIIAGIGNGPTKDYYNEYDKVNSLLDMLAQETAEFLKNLGFRAFPQTRENVTDDEKTWRTILPHKTIATKSAMGWIGKCALLVTKEYGSAIRITSVLTNANFDVSQPIVESNCGPCTNCQNACPGNAVKGTNWNVNTDRDIFFDPHACRAAARARASKIGINATICGMCIFVCPWTKRYLAHL